MTEPTGRARRDALGLLLAGYTPEEVEAILAGEVAYPDALTALTDPTNVLMQEVNDDDAGTPARPR